MIGEEHLRRLCTSIGGEAQSFKYFLSPGYADGLPYVVEIATCAYKKWVQEGAPGPELGPTRSFLITAMTGGSDSNQTPMASADPSEELVSRKEKPLDIQAPPKTAPRVISTMPISPVTIRSDGSDGRPCHADDIWLAAGTSSGIGTGFS